MFLVVLLDGRKAVRLSHGAVKGHHNLDKIKIGLALRPVWFKPDVSLEVSHQIVAQSDAELSAFSPNKCR